MLAFEFLPMGFSDSRDLPDAALENTMNDSTEGYLIYGMFIDGAQWDYANGVLAD